MKRPKSRTLMPSSTFIYLSHVDRPDLLSVTDRVEFRLQLMRHRQQVWSQFALHARTRHGMAGAYTNQHKRCITFQQRRRGKDSQLGLPFAYGGAIPVLADLRHTDQGTVAPRRPVA